LVAVTVSGYVPPLPVAGVPLRTPVVASKVTPDGNVPVTAIVGVGLPVAVKVKVPADPSNKSVLLALVMAGVVCTIVSVVVQPKAASCATAITRSKHLKNQFFILRMFIKTSLKLF
jgi:hypothetical protein